MSSTPSRQVTVSPTTSPRQGVTVALDDTADAWDSDSNSFHSAFEMPPPSPSPSPEPQVPTPEPHPPSPPPAPEPRTVTPEPTLPATTSNPCPLTHEQHLWKRVYAECQSSWVHPTRPGTTYNRVLLHFYPPLTIITNLRLLNTTSVQIFRTPGTEQVEEIHVWHQPNERR